MAYGFMWDTGEKIFSSSRKAIAYIVATELDNQEYGIVTNGMTGDVEVYSLAEFNKLYNREDPAGYITKRVVNEDYEGSLSQRLEKLSIG